MSQEKRTYRSAAWFGKTDKDGFVHRSWMRNQGLPDYVFDGRPVIGIATPGRNSRLAMPTLRNCRACKTGRVGSRRAPAGISRDVAGRDEHAPHSNALPESG